METEETEIGNGKLERKGGKLEMVVYSDYVFSMRMNNQCIIRYECERVDYNLRFEADVYVCEV